MAPQPGSDGEDESWRWRTDFKWIFAIPFSFLLVIALAVFTGFELTGQQRAESIIAAMDAPLVAQPQFHNDLSVGAPDLYAFLSSPGFAGAIYQSPSQLQDRINMIPDDLNAQHLPPAAARALARSRGDTAGSGLGGSGSAYRSALGIYSAPMRFLSSGAHAAAGKILAVLIVLLLLTGIPMFIFSRRLGKVVSIGACLAVASWLPYLFVSLMQRRMDGWVTNGGGQAQTNQQQLLKDSLRPFFDGVFGEATTIYRDFAVVALLFLAAAGVIYLILRLRPQGFPGRRRF